MRREVWQFMRTHYAGDVFLVFDSAQASLLNLIDAKEAEKDDRQPDLIPPARSRRRRSRGLMAKRTRTVERPLRSLSPMRFRSAAWSGWSNGRLRYADRSVRTLSVPALGP